MVYSPRTKKTPDFKKLTSANNKDKLPLQKYEIVHQVTMDTNPRCQVCLKTHTHTFVWIAHPPTHPNNLPRTHQNDKNMRICAKKKKIKKK